MNFKDETIKATGIVLICHYLVREACRKLSKETGVYQNRLRNDITRLLKNSQFVIKSAESLENIQVVSQILGKSVEMEEVNENIQTECQIFKDIFEIIYTGNPQRTYNLSLLLDNVKNDRPLYTKEEVEYENQKAINEYWKIKT